MLEFKIRKSVKVFEDVDEITLSVGVMENNIITICKKDLSDYFKNVVRRLLEGESILLEAEDECYSDMINIYNLGFLSVIYPSENKNILLINIDENFEVNLKIYKGVEVINYSDLFNDDEANVLITKVDALSYKSAYKKFEQKFKEYKCVMVVGGLCYLNKLLMINSIVINSFIPSVFFTYDVSSCFVLGVNSKMGTGCFECFITNLLSKKEFADIKYQSNTSENNLGINYFINSVINTEIQNINVFNESILYGNILTYIPGIYQYTFDFNRRTVQCDNCTEDFYDSFEEQNIASINVIKEIVGEENV